MDGGGRGAWAAHPGRTRSAWPTAPCERLLCFEELAVSGKPEHPPTEVAPLTRVNTGETPGPNQ